MTIPSEPNEQGTDRVAECRTELEQRFSHHTADPMMQALFDAVLAWMLEKDAQHDTGRNPETH
ncbi:MAG: hypothetical protein N3B18_02610 [Desulfobacterota bacterium]|nr:hypothetical protein [Thermodesulfobacteriota bacterium]